METLHPIDDLPPRAAAGECILLIGESDQIERLAVRLRSRGFQEDGIVPPGHRNFPIGPGRIKFIVSGYDAETYLDRHCESDLNEHDWDVITDVERYQPVGPEDRYANTISELRIVQQGWRSKASDRDWFTTPTKRAVNELLNDIEHVIKKNLGDHG